jgi:hypothetical protein
MAGGCVRGRCFDFCNNGWFQSSENIAVKEPPVLILGTKCIKNKKEPQGSFFFFFPPIFCDVAQVAIIHKRI